jgi:hypothetical protein
MEKLLILTLLLSLSTAFGQTSNKSNCKIEFYLLKSNKPNLDIASQIKSDSFAVDKCNLADTAFITDQEIDSYSFKSDTSKFVGKVFISNRVIFQVSKIVTNRIRNLGACKQFALVVNDEIIYSGHFWDTNYEFICGPMKAIANDTTVDVYLGKNINYALCNRASKRR